VNSPQKRYSQFWAATSKVRLVSPKE